MQISIYSMVGCISAFVIAFVGLLAYSKSKANRANFNYFIFCISIFIWQLTYAIAFSIDRYEVSVIWLKIGFTGVVIIPAALFSFTLAFLRKKTAKRTEYICYSFSLILILLLWFSDLLINGAHSFFWGHYPRASILHPVFVLYMSFSFTASIILLFLEAYKLERGSVNFQRCWYLAWSLSVGVFGSVDFIANYGYQFYPFGWVFVDLLASIVAYAIIKYRLLDITIAITRTGIFIAVYSIVLGVPFALAFGWREQLQRLIGEMWWLVPLVSSTVLATVGPSIYFYIQQRAEDRLLQEQRRYQTTLRRASLGMGKVKDLKRLLKLTVNIVTRTVRIAHCEIYLSHKLSERYILKASQGWVLAEDKRVSFIPAEASLVQYLKKHPEPLVYDEVKQRGQDFKDEVLIEIGKIMEELDAALLVPSFIEDELLAVLVLGKKRSGKLYSHDDLIVFSILANQAALAIENAQFYEEMKKTHDQLMKAEKMATIGTMADGLSHQINNRLHAMGFIASDALDTIKLQPKENLPPEAKKVYAEMEVSLGKIQENVKRGGEIVEGLLKYSRKTDEGFAAIELGNLLDAALEMAQFKIKLNQIDIARNFNGSIAKIRGNFTQLQEVFFNMIDNAYDAMMQRKEEMKEPGYRGRLEISTHEDGNHLEIFIKDNGIGVKEKDFKRLFTPFFTTKLSSKKGTGLGLYVIRKIIEENHGGKVEFTSEYQKGSQTRLVLPIAA